MNLTICSSLHITVAVYKIVNDGIEGRLFLFGSFRRCGNSYETPRYVGIVLEYTDAILTKL